MKKLLTAAALASALLLSAPAAFAENWVEVAGYQGRMIDTDSCKVQGNTPVLTVRPTDGTEMTIQFNKKDMTYQFLSLKRLDGNGKVIDEVPADKLAGHFLPLKEGSLISSLYMQYVAYPIPQLANAEWVTIYRTGMGANAGSRVSIDKNHISYDGDYAVFWLKNDYVPAEKASPPKSTRSRQTWQTIRRRSCPLHSTMKTEKSSSTTPEAKPQKSVTPDRAS